MEKELLPHQEDALEAINEWLASKTGFALNTPRGRANRGLLRIGLPITRARKRFT